MDSLKISLLLVTFSLLTSSISSQQCTLDGSNIYPPVEVNETSAIGLLKTFGASRVISISPTLNKYIELDLIAPNTELNVNLIGDLRKNSYFKEETSDSFIVEFLAKCDASSTPNFATVTVKDFNDEPEFDARSVIFEIQSPYDLTIPINYANGGEIYVVDWDWEEEFATNITFRWTSDSIIHIDADPLWVNPTERPRRFKLTITLKQQLYTNLTFTITAYDASDPTVPEVEQDIEIRVTLTNISPPIFDKPYYRATISEFPEGGSSIEFDGGPMFVSDRENNEFTVTVTSPSDLIQLDYNSVTGLVDVKFKDPLAIGDIIDLPNGVAFVEITAAETTTEARESTVLIAILFNNELIATTATPIECTTLQTTTELTCPPCTSAIPEYSSTVCPETTITESSSCEPCPSISTDAASTACPETPPTVCPDITSIWPGSSVSGVTECNCESCQPCSTTESTSTACPETPPTICPEITSISPGQSSVTECNCESYEPVSTTELMNTIYPETPSSACPDTPPTGATECNCAPCSTTESLVSTVCPDCPSTEVTEQNCAPCSSTESLISTVCPDCPSTGVTECNCAPCSSTESLVSTVCPDCPSTEVTEQNCAPCSSTESLSTVCPDIPICPITDQSAATESNCAPCSTSESTITDPDSPGTPPRECPTQAPCPELPATNCPESTSVFTEITSTCQPCDCESVSSSTCRPCDTEPMPCTSTERENPGFSCPEHPPCPTPTDCPPTTTSATEETPISCAAEDSHTGFIVGLVVLGVLLLVSAGVAAYMWRLLRKISPLTAKLSFANWNPKPAYDTEPVIPDDTSASDENEYNSVQYSEPDPIPPPVTFTVESEPPLKTLSEPIDFGTRGRKGSKPDFLQAQATNPLVEESIIPTAVVEPDIPQPDYAKKEISFDEKVMVKTFEKEKPNEDNDDDANESPVIDGEVDDGDSRL